VRGPRRSLLDLATENARHAFDEKRRSDDDIDERLARLQQRLRLPTLPRRIECCDISHLGGMDTVGAVVALYQGTPDKKHYRTYHVRGAAEGDDYRAMYEVLGRRFRRGKAARAEVQDPVTVAISPEESAAPASQTNPLGAEGDPSADPARDADWALPDLFVVDGGRGQLQVALAAAHDLGLHELPIVGLAKEREQLSGGTIVDRVYLPGQKNPILLRPNSPELFILALARDEAHRFSNRGRKKLGSRRRFESALDSVKGLGPKTRAELLKVLGSVAILQTATDAEILAVPGVNRRHLAAIRDWLKASDTPDVSPDVSPDEPASKLEP
jgi:excinuclease ABC subunit C